MTRTPLRISLLHATYRREGGPLEVKRAWLDAAVDPSTIEYVFAMDDDDIDSLRETAGHLRAVGPGGSDVVTSVRNWNAAAAIATGDLLVVVADDLFPPPAWDLQLMEMVYELDPRSLAFALKLADSAEDVGPDLPPIARGGPPLLRHPVVSRAFYSKLGLFSPRFSGVFCDNDITLRAFWKAAIFDGRTLRLDHRHPTLDSCHPSSESQRLVNATDEFRRGQEALHELWSRRQRAVSTRLLGIPGRRRLTNRQVLVLSRWVRLQSLGSFWWGYVRRRGKAAALLIFQPRRLQARVRRPDSE